MAKILIVEDDSTLQKVFSEVLKKEGYETSVADTGQKALQEVSKDKPSLMLLDIMLPGGLNGFDVLMHLKRDNSSKDIPVIVLSNLDSEKQTALDYGASDYYFKANMDFQTLIAKIKHLLT